LGRILVARRLAKPKIAFGLKDTYSPKQQMDLVSTAKKHWQLTQEAFQRLLDALSPDDSEAGEKYLSLRKNLVRFFGVRQVADPDDAADEVIDRLARKLEAGENYEDIPSYALGIARMHALELYKRPKITDAELIPEIGVQPNSVECEEIESKLDCLDTCLAELTDQKREIIVGYYEGEKRKKIENRASLAQRLGIPANALRSRAVRLRDSLESCILKCIDRYNRQIQ
jgi:RNA polymerase sigma factor (sigma-70 family)